MNQFAEPTIEDRFRAYALAEATRLEAEAKILWEEFQRVEVDVAPHIARLDAARSKWCAVHNRAQYLRELYPDGCGQ